MGCGLTSFLQLSDRECSKAHLGKATKETEPPKGSSMLLLYALPLGLQCIVLIVALAFSR